LASATAGGDDATGEARERQRLQPHLAGSAQRREEKAFAAEQRRLHAADKLDVVVNRRLKAHDAARVDAEHFPGRERTLVKRAARVDERPAIAGQPLHDEAFAAKQSGTEPFLKRDADAHAL